MQHFEALCHAMTDPSFYPHPVFHLERRDTHISSVFLTGKWVYKLKKAVDFGFLNFQSLEDRRRFCELEVVLNRRLSQGIYEGIVSICEESGGRFSLGGKGRVVEYAVKMRQLPHEASLTERLIRKKIYRKQMERLGHRLADFYDKSVRNSEIDHYGQRDVIAFNVEENFRQLEPFVDDVLDRERWEFLCQVSRSFLQSRSRLFDHRVKTGRIRDGHGDLRPDHIYFYRGIQIIDCIEFNDRFRYGDVVVDLAFLHMDMEHQGHSDRSLTFLAAYVDHADDPGLYSLLDFYAAYRAIVRLKIACLRLQEIENPEERQSLKDDARRYMDQAYRYALQFSRPTLWVFCGLPATGKSYLSSRISEALMISLFQSDLVRKEMSAHFQQEVVSFGQGIYRSEMRHRVYAQLLALAQENIKQGHSVILDATFSHRKWRDEIRQLAEDLDTNFMFVECVCEEAILRERLRQRENETGLSDARLQHLPHMIKDFEPLDELEPETHLRVSTDQASRRSFLEVLWKGYAGKCEQVRKIL